MPNPTVTVELSPEAYECLRTRAAEAGTTPEALVQKLLQEQFEAPEAAGSLTGPSSAATPPTTAREVLAASGRLREIGPHLRARIIPGVTLEEVRQSLSRAGGPSLSEIVLANRGPKE
jgi:hypothetical protein